MPAVDTSDAWFRCSITSGSQAAVAAQSYGDDAADSGAAQNVLDAAVRTDATEGECLRVPRLTALRNIGHEKSPKPGTETERLVS